MGKYLESYLDQLENEEIKESVSSTVNDIVDNHISTFSYQEHTVGLLLGEVQSGKTGQMLGIISAAADSAFDISILLTTDNVRLQEQTYRRALRGLNDFCVCSENDEIRFTENRMRRPVLVILKKNYKVLEKWRNNLTSSGFLSSGRSLFIVDDEGDAASLNTKVNKNDVSTINMHLDNIKQLSTSSIYLQVTATPQPIILQTKISGWKPSFLQYFKPGKKYLGGDFFYSEPRSYAVKIIPEDELENIRSDNDYITEGLSEALLTFLVSAAHIFIKGHNTVCNFLIHPSIKIADHNLFAQKIGELLNELLISNGEGSLEPQLKSVWSNLQETKPDIVSFNKIFAYITDTLVKQNVNIYTLNSNSSYDDKYDVGINIIVGGNSLGRGVTFAGLQTVYYSRSSKIPQADTFWQHCRMFGYDRDPGLMRIFLPAFLLKLFTELNNAHRALVKQILDTGIDDIHLIYPSGVRPTRNNVIDKDSLNLIIGGVNYFPNYPKNASYREIDKLLDDYESKEAIEISISYMLEILKLMDSEDSEDWNSGNYISCLESISENKRLSKGKLIVRRERQLSKGTGTMLSENDRRLVAKLKGDVVLVVYRVTGEVERGWDGEPVWMPNIKLPEGFVFHKTRD